MEWYHRTIRFRYHTEYAVSRCYSDIAYHVCYFSIKSKGSIFSFFHVGVYLPFFLILACFHSILNYPCVRFISVCYQYVLTYVCVCVFTSASILHSLVVYIRKCIHVFFCIDIRTHVVRASRYDSQILRRASHLRSTFVYTFTHSRTAFPPYIEVTSVPCAESVAGKREEEEEGEIGREKRRVRLAITGALESLPVLGIECACARNPLCSRDMSKLKRRAQEATMKHVGK